MSERAIFCKRRLARGETFFARRSQKDVAEGPGDQISAERKLSDYHPFIEKMGYILCPFGKGEQLEMARRQLPTNANAKYMCSNLAGNLLLILHFANNYTVQASEVRTPRI